KAPGSTGLPGAGPLPAPASGSAGVFDGPGLPDDGHLDLARVLQLAFDPLHDVAGHLRRFCVVDAVGFDHDAHFAPRLDSVGLFDPFVRVGDGLELFEAADVVFQRLAAGAGPGGGNGVGRRDQHRLDGLRLVVAVVALHRVDHFTRLLVPGQQAPADLDVRPLHLVVDRLADVVQESGPLGHVDVRTQLRGHNPREVGHLDAVLQDVLAVAGAELQPSQELDQLRMQAVYPCLEGGLLALFPDDVFHFFLGLFHHLFDASRVDAAVGHQLLQGDPGDLPADGIKA